MSGQRFLRDLLDVAEAGGDVTRRRLLRLALAGAGSLASGCLAAGSPAFMDGGAWAAERPARIVHANWGGDAAACTAEHYGAPFTRATGIAVEVDGSGPLGDLIRTLVKTGQVPWDCCDADGFVAIRLGREGLLEPIDYGIVDRAKVTAPFAHEYGVASYLYSTVLAFDRSRFGAMVPGWADFWDVATFPGKRALPRQMHGALEAALLADGVPRDRLYPLDLPRAFRKIEEIKEHLVFWSSGMASQALFLEEDIVMGSLWHTRAALLEEDTHGRVGWTWKDGLLAAGSWIVPKGNPAGRDPAMRWIASMQEPARQIAMMDCAGQGPANPASIPLLDAAQRRLHPGAPDNRAQQVVMDDAYFASHYDEALAGYLALTGA
jgi:putative spermidine/putrescine transport system substrate-binding protein